MREMRLKFAVLAGKSLMAVHALPVFAGTGAGPFLERTMEGAGLGKARFKTAFTLGVYYSF
jgi:hypothetical protein